MNGKQENMLETMDPTRILTRYVEPGRKRARLSIRDAAERAGLSEATWRQLVNGKVKSNGYWITRTARRDQLLDMAHAVGVEDVVAKEISATPEELHESKSRVVILDPAESEIMKARHLRPAEKLRLLEQLRELRDEPPRH